ncbi:MAG: helix-turn-helix domain-containing protein [Planctomycetota bacterium]
MSARILLMCASDPRRRLLEDLLADARTVVRPLGSGAADVPWSGPAPDLLVLGAFGRTGDAVAVAQVALAAEANLSVLVVDEAENWPQALLGRAGLAVVSLQARGGFQAARERLLERRRLLREVADRRTEPRDALAAEALLGDVPAVREMRLLLERAAERHAPVVLAGEPGTLRRRLLRHVLRTEEDLRVDSELLLVEDVDELPPPKQGALLRFMEQGRRIVATATPRFRERMRDGQLRNDLYYKLGGQAVEVVPLRKRLGDLERLARAAGLGPESSAALAPLQRYDWPGNLRELELVVQHAALLAGGGPVTPSHLALPEDALRRLAGESFVLRLPQTGVALADVEKEAIRQTLVASDSNITEAARRLAVERGKLRYRLRKFGLGR